MSVSAFSITVRAVLVGMVIAMAGPIPRNILFFANLRIFPSLPWSVPLAAIYIGLFWRYLHRDASLRANPLPLRSWGWSLAAGASGIVALVLALRIANQFIALPPQTFPDLGAASPFTIVSLLIAGAPIAGIIEESAFRGYMQGPIERSYGLPLAILITGTMFALAHLDFTPVLWPYYVAVAALYGLITHATNSILPTIVLHTAGNLYSNLDLYLHGQAEWQAPAVQAASIWKTGPTNDFWFSIAAILITTAFATWAYTHLRKAVAQAGTSSVA